MEDNRGVNLFLPLSKINFWTKSCKKINIAEVFVVLLIPWEHLLQKTEEDQREAAGFQEEPSRTLHIYSVRGKYASAGSSLHKKDLIKRNTNPKQDPESAQQSLSNLNCNMTSYLSLQRNELPEQLGHLQEVQLGANNRLRDCKERE